MNIKKLFPILFFSSLNAGLLSAQTTLNLEGNVNIKDDPGTGSAESPIKEGNLRVNGSLVISDNAPIYAYATGVNSIGVGRSPRAVGDCSIAVGGSSYATWARSEYSIAIGAGTEAGGTEGEQGYNFAYGHFAKAINIRTTAFGLRSEASGMDAVALGRSTIASGDFSYAIGHAANATGYNGFAIGTRNKASGGSSLALGHDTIAAHTCTYAMGHNAQANGYMSMALGHFAQTSHSWTYLYGRYLKSETENTVIVGCYNKPTIETSAAYWRATDPVFVVGNGYNEEQRSNALVVQKNGNTTVNGDLTANNIKVKRPAGGIPMGDFGN